MVTAQAQPDQRPESWNDHVSVYEDVFEPFSQQFAEAAIADLRLSKGNKVLDVAAGSGGAALFMAARGCAVTAIDASAQMCERIISRGQAARLPMDARVMDGQALVFHDAAFDAAVSVFGVILFPDTVRGLTEMRRVVRRGGRVALVTWTEPQAFELAREMRTAIAAVRPNQAAAPLPAQLRYRERADFEMLFQAAGFEAPAIAVHTAHLRAPSARWLGERLAFAPGMAAQIARLGADAPAVIKHFVAQLETRFGQGEISLSGKAFVGVASVP